MDADRLIIAESDANDPNRAGRILREFPRLRGEFARAFEVEFRLNTRIGPARVAVFCQHGGKTLRVGNCGCDSPW